jgi:hypothetical protein
MLSDRALNRALLARQMLLERVREVSACDAIRRLVALQAQLARPPFVALWTRLADFSREQLAAPVHERKLVRATMMRGTIHLLAADDYSEWRGVIHPCLEGGLRSILREWVPTADLEALEKEAREFFGSKPATFDAYRDHVKALRPGTNERAPAYAMRMRIPLVQVPTDATWCWPAAAEFALADDWLGRSVPVETKSARSFVLRYLAAFGPASVADAQGWSGLGGLRVIFEELRPRLLTFRDERNRELFDLPDAPRPGDDVAAPVRFLPEFDNAVLGHDDRSRIVAEAYRPRLVTKNLLVPATFLVDGFVAGTWSVTRKRKTATLTLVPFGKLTKKNLSALTAEAEAMLAFTEPDATPEVEVGG